MVENFLKNKLFLIIIGIILGILIYFGPSIILSILVLWSLFSFLSKRSQREKGALTKIIIIALILRLMFFAISLYILYCARLDVSEYSVRIVGHTVQVVRDFGREIKNGIAIAQYLKGEFGNVPIREISVHGAGFLHAGAWTQGILNFIFGVSIFNLLLFPLIDLWAIVILFYLSRQLFDEKVASFSSFLYAIMPSTIIISCTNLRFSLSILSLLLIAFSLLKFTRANNFKSLLLLMAGVILFTIFRDKASKPLLFILPFILLIALNIKFRAKFVFLAIVTIFLVISLNTNVFIQEQSTQILKNIVASQVGFTAETGPDNYSNYKIYDDVVYVTNIIESMPPLALVKILSKGLFKGIIFFIFVPFPWQVTNVTRLYFYPQIIFWYFITPFAIFGMIRSLFFKTKETLPIILLCGYFVVLLSLVLGNEGIAIRYRELITPFFYIFAGSILYKFKTSSKTEDYKIR